MSLDLFITVFRDSTCTILIYTTKLSCEGVKNLYLHPTEVLSWSYCPVALLNVMPFDASSLRLHSHLSMVKAFKHESTKLKGGSVSIAFKGTTLIFTPN